MARQQARDQSRAPAVGSEGQMFSQPPLKQSDQNLEEVNALNGTPSDDDDTAIIKALRGSDGLGRKDGFSAKKPRVGKAVDWHVVFGEKTVRALGEIGRAESRERGE